MSNSFEVSGSSVPDLVPDNFDRELDSRTSDGIDVQLFHRPGSEPAYLYLIIRDTKRSVEYDPVPVSPESAFDDFHHLPWNKVVARNVEVAMQEEVTAE